MWLCRQARALAIVAALFSPLQASGQTAVTLEVAAHAQDIEYDAVRGQLWISLAPLSAGQGAVTSVDPITGSIGVPIAVSNDPNQIAISADSAFLYVSHFTSADIHRIDLAQRAIDLSFQSDYPSTADLEVHPLDPHAVAVSRDGGVAIFDDGQRRPNYYSLFVGSRFIEFDANGDYIYGYDPDSSDFGLHRIRVDASGATHERQDRRMLVEFDRDFVLAGGQLVHETGRTLDPAAREVLGTYPRPPFQAINAVAVDLPNDAVYMAVRGELLVFDRSSFSLRSRHPLPTNLTGVAGMTGWGIGRVAIATFGPQLFVVDLGLDITNGDGDLLIDAVDNCPANANSSQSDGDADGIGDVCDADPNAPPPAPIDCAAELARTAADAAVLASHLVACVGAGYPDADGDGKPDSGDRCSGTATGASIDAAGCSQPQFCSASASACTRADWRNDEAASKKPGDCSFVAGVCTAR